MLRFHVPALINNGDTFGAKVTSTSGTAPTYPADSTSPLTRYMHFGATAGTIVYSPNMNKTTKVSVAFWYRCGAVNEGATGSWMPLFMLRTQSAVGPQYFRLESHNTNSTSYTWYNNGNFTNSGGVGGTAQLEKGNWYHMAFSTDIETGEWEKWVTPLNGTTTYTSGKITPNAQCYFLDFLQINKVAQFSSADYSDIRIYDDRISEFEVREILKRPICHLDFNDPNNTKFDSTVIDLFDMGNNATVLEAGKEPLVNTDSALGESCAEFTGTQSFQLPDACKIQGNFTVAWWYYRTDTYGNSSILTSNQDPISCGPSGANGWRTYTRDNTNLFFQDNGTNKYCGFGANSLPVNQWHHFAFAFDFTAKNVKLYTDGVLKSTTSFTRTSMAYNTVPLTVGSYANANFLKAKLDDLRIYASTLTLEDINQLYKQRLNIDNKCNWNCSLIQETSGTTIGNNLITDGSFETTSATSSATLTASLTTDEAYIGNHSLKLTSTMALNPTRSLTGWSGITITYDSVADTYKFNGTSGAGSGLASFLWIPLPEHETGKTITCTLEYVVGSVTLTNATSGDCYACPVVDIGTAINTNVPTRHYSDMGKYPDATTKTVSRTITLTQADIDSMKGVRIWLHTRGASTNYGATIINFNAYQMRIKLTYDRGTSKDSHVDARTPIKPLVKNHKYYISAMIKNNNDNATNGQVYLGAWESCPISGSFTNDNQWHLYSGITNDTWADNFKTTSQAIRFDFDVRYYCTTPYSSYWDDLKVIDLTEMFGTSIPSKAECDAKFNGASTGKNLNFIDSKSISSPKTISEIGRPMRYIKISCCGNNKNTANHIVKLSIDTVDSGHIELVNALKYFTKIIKGQTGITAGNPNYYSFGNNLQSIIVDIGSIVYVTNINLALYYGDTRYYYQKKIEGSLDNTTYFTIWDSHNTGTYATASAAASSYNTENETADGINYKVEPDMFHLVTTGDAVVHKLTEG